MLSQTVSSREQRARRALARIGHRLEKSRIRPGNEHFNNQGGYQIIDVNLNLVLAGSNFDLSLEQVEDWLAE